ncbi:MAG: FAD-binding oxidoreductase [Oscillospiraceae bacterium]|jgi:D-lactate dehydrogenase (cytochrome)
MLMRPFTDEFAEYLRDESRSAGEAESISFPRTEAEVIEIMRQTAAGIPVTIQGGRTGLTAASVPRGGHILNLSRMDKFTGARYDEEEDAFFLRCQSGVMLSRLRRALREKDFDTALWDEKSIKALGRMKPGEWFFSPDPTETSATIGGMAACNASGARTFLFGPTRNYIEELRIVLYDGDTLRLRRGERFAEDGYFSITTDSGRIIEGQLPLYPMPEVKSAAGYYIKPNMDLIDLFIGSEGTLGIITGLEIRLLREPEEINCITAFFRNEKTALDYVYALRGLSFRPAAIEYFNGDALNLLERQRVNNPAFAAIEPIADDFKGAVYCEFHSEAPLEDLCDIIESLGASPDDTWFARTEADMEKLRFFRHAVPESVNMLIDVRRRADPGITKLGTDMSVPDSELYWVMDMYNSDLQEAGLESVIFGHIGNNHLHVNILPRDLAEYRAGKQLYAKWAREIVRRGGSVSAEHGIGKLKTDFMTIMCGIEAVGRMRRFKSLFDPPGILSPGNIFAPEE